MASHQNLHLGCGCSASGPFKLQETERKYERSRPFVVTHQALDLSLDFEGSAVGGTATLDFSRRAPQGTRLTLDAVAFELFSVRLKVAKGRPKKLTRGTDYQYDGDLVEIEVPADVDHGQVVIEYRAVPRQGLYFKRPDAEVPDRPLQAWSQCQDEDGRHFFPCQDKPHVKMTSEMRVTVPHGMTVLSGGELRSKETPKRGPWVFHYQLTVPAPAYLITLVAGHFDEWQEELKLPSGKSIPLRYLVPIGKAADGRRAFSATGEMIRLFSQVTGVDYPWDRYSQVVVSEFIFGGMENTTATTMYEHILLDERAAIDIESHDLVAHELAHQWFGDLVTCRDWPHAWLNEGFATYFELVEKEARLGWDEYQEGVLVDFEAYLVEARSSYTRPIVCRDYDEPIDLFDRHLYQKGGGVLHLLRTELGDDCFWRGIRGYLEKHRGGIVETTDLKRALEDASGLSLDAFFDHWVYRPGHPELTVKLSYGHGELTIEVEQTQKGDDVATFELLVEVRALVGKEEFSSAKRVTGRKDSLVIACPKRPTVVEFDPNLRLLATIDLSGPQDILRTTLGRGRSARVRKLAATALGKRHDPENVEALGECLQSEQESYIVRTQAATSLGKIAGPRVRELLHEAARTKEPKVRRAVAQVLGQFEDPDTVKLLSRLTQDESYLVAGTAARALGSTRQPSVEKVLVKLLAMDSWADVVRAGALDGLAKSGLPDVERHLMEWSQYGKPLRVRRAAISALPRTSDKREVREHLIRLLRDRDPHTRTAVLGALGSLGDRRAVSAITDLLEQELDGRVRRHAKQVIVDLGKPGLPGLSEATQKAQKLERELSGLQARLARLEQLHHQKLPGAKTAHQEPATGRDSAKKSQKARPRRSSEPRNTPGSRAKPASGNPSRKGRRAK